MWMVLSISLGSCFSLHTCPHIRLQLSPQRHGICLLAASLALALSLANSNLEPPMGVGSGKDSPSFFSSSKQDRTPEGEVVLPN